MSEFVSQIAGEQTVYIVSVIIILSAVISFFIWMYRDAKVRGADNPLILAIVTTLVPPLFLYYIFRILRGDLADSIGVQKPSEDKMLAMWAAAGVPAYLISAMISPPDVIIMFTNMVLYIIILLPIVYTVVYLEGYQALLDKIVTE